MAKMTIDEFLDSPLDQYDLSGRTYQVLVNAKGCSTWRDVVKYSENELLREVNFGRVSLREIKDILIRHGAHLKRNIERHWISCRVDPDVFDKLTLLCRASGKTMDVELERIITSAVSHMPHIGDLATRLDRLEQAVFGTEDRADG